MTTSADIRTLNCTQCGAPLELLGGHQVRSLTCGYCGSIMDAHEDFKVVKEYEKIQRPKTHLKQARLEIGMKGIIKDVEFTIIGIIEHTNQSVYKWLDFQLFSPTHGYAFMSYEDGEYTFTRRTRDIPEPAVIEPGRTPLFIKACGHNMEFDEHFTSRISFVEGELTWIAKRGDKTEVFEALASPYSFSYEVSGDELEYHFGEDMSVSEIYQAFGIKETPKPQRQSSPGSNTLTTQPDDSIGFWAALQKVSGWFILFACVAFIFVLFWGWGSVVLDERIDNPLTPRITKPFQVSDPNSLMQLNLESSLQNTWAAYGVTINKKNGESVFSLNKNLEYYSGYEGGESWSEGSNSTSALFKVPEAGEYFLEIEAEGELTALPSLNVKIYEGVLVWRYFVYLMIFCTICTVVGFFLRDD